MWKKSSSNSSNKWPTAIDNSLPEIELYSSAKERKAYDNMSDLYTIIIATEHLERAYAQDAITHEEYTTECNKLLSQFKIAEKAALGNKSGMTTETFMKVVSVISYYCKSQFRSFCSRDMLIYLFINTNSIKWTVHEQQIDYLIRAYPN